MKVKNHHYRTIWAVPNEPFVEIIDQRWLPHRFEIERIYSVHGMATAIREMHIRGAGAIGAAAGFGMYLATLESAEHTFESVIDQAAHVLKSSRPTAVNLEWAVDRMLRAIHSESAIATVRKRALLEAKQIADEDEQACRQIGQHGKDFIESNLMPGSGKPLNILTHCNAGWLAFVDYGTATAPIYALHDAGVDVHVWVGETRPRNQGARLTAWELANHGVPHTVIADNTGGHLMQHGKVDMVIVGCDRTSITGFVTNKIGTYLKALAAHDNDVPFFVALPSASIDWNLREGSHAPIEERSGDEVKFAQGILKGEIQNVLLTMPECTTANYAFDVTPPRLVTRFITERGVVPPTEEELLDLFPEQRRN